MDTHAIAYASKDSYSSFHKDKEQQLKFMKISFYCYDR